ncbi:tetratricopeptide repeat protein [Spongiivirga citrea]|uniref:Tetratricopeptide repeat protein n=1 Tax=Spongiivirga citrea TaxID=1481457 RepID=A0A6M0CM38_9FLAO|nr:hypothetical protein [Spongiivirga citrea]NER19006.1 hypothetical protein [Spongiivirga citrea]
MLVQKTIHVLLLLGFCIPQLLLSQQVEINDDLGDVTDEFQEHFFEALKQRGIENYEKALVALLKCQRIDDTKAIVNFEIGKNNLLLKKFDAAEVSLKKALEKSPNNEWYLESLYEVYYQTQNLDLAITTVKKLIAHHPIYKEDLLTLYMRTRQFKNAIAVLDDLDATQGRSYSRDSIRAQLYTISGFDNEEVNYWNKRISDNPKNEKNYLSLIYLLSEKGDANAAFKVSERLLKSIPDSKLAHLGLFKYYLEKEEIDKAVNSMNTVVKATQINKEAKFKVIYDFMRYAETHPDQELALENAATLFSEIQGSKSIYMDLANFFLKKNNDAQGTKYMQLALGGNNLALNNFDALKKQLFLLAERKDFKTLYDNSTKAIDNYPSQPVLYFLKGAASNNLQKYKEAIDVLEIGIDFVVDDIKLESSIYKELIVAYRSLNNFKKVKYYESQLIRINS